MDRSEMDQMLAMKTWAVIGLSNNSERPAYRVAALLQKNGHRIVPVHPNFAKNPDERVHGQKGYENLATIPFPIEVVDLFVNSTAVGGVVDEAIAIGAKGVWLQLEVIDESAVQRARSHRLLAVMNHCPAIEYEGFLARNG